MSSETEGAVGMRKDVKLGLIICGTLLAVLVIYVLSGTGGSASKELADQSTGGTGGASLQQPAPQHPVELTQGGATTQPDGTTTTSLIAGGSTTSALTGGGAAVATTQPLVTDPFQVAGSGTGTG